MGQNINAPSVFAGAQLSVGASAVSLADFFTQEQVDQAARAYIYVNTNNVRIRTDGTAPTAAIGFIVGSGIIVDGFDIQNIQMIQNGASAAEVYVELAQ